MMKISQLIMIFLFLCTLIGNDSKIPSSQIEYKNPKINTISFIQMIEIAGSEGDCDNCELTDPNGQVVFSCRDSEDNKCKEKDDGITLSCARAEKCGS